MNSDDPSNGSHHEQGHGSHHQPLQAPVPYQQFEYNFPFPSTFIPPPLPDHHPPTELNDLFSPSEHGNILGFLDQFDWQFDPHLPHGMPAFSASPERPNGQHIPLTPSLGGAITHPPTEPSPIITGPVYMSSHNVFPPSSSSFQSTMSDQQQQPPAQSMPSLLPHHHPPDPIPKQEPISASSPSDGQSSSSRPSAKPLLSTPQKRLNHIMSEQKRRNTIRDGYATLTAMLAPHASIESDPLPRGARGRGRGARGRGRGKGKSGVLFRAVEYVKWLEEGVEDLTAEVEKLESATRPGWIPQ